MSAEGQLVRSFKKDCDARHNARFVRDRIQVPNHTVVTVEILVPSAPVSKLLVLA